MTFVTDDLEDACRRIAKKARGRTSNASPESIVGRRIALTLDQIDAVRQRQRALGKRHVDKELYLDSEIMNLRSKPVLKNNWLEQTRLRNEYGRMLDSSERHAQRLAIENETALQHLHTRLMELWNIYCQLATDDGDS